MTRGDGSKNGATAGAARPGHRGGTQTAWRSAAVGALSLGLLLHGGACGDDALEDGYAPQPPKATTTVKQKQEGTTPEGQAPGAGPYTYSPVGKRDPFRSYLADLVEQRSAENKQVRKQPTEKFDLDQYRLTAIVIGTAQPRAMVEDPDNRGHTVRIGTRIGRHGGRVTHISSRGISVVEEARDATGKRVRVTKRIDLPRTEIEAPPPR